MPGQGTTVVYIDLVVLLNFTANYLLLLAAGRLAGLGLSRPRIAGGAALGAAYAAAVFLPGCQWLTAWPCKLGAGVLMALAAFGAGRGLLRVTVIFFAAGAALAGGVLAVQLLGGGSLTLANGVFYSQADVRLLLLLFVACYFILSLFFRGAGRRGRRELTQVRGRLLEREFSLTALVDSGHSLVDPATNRPVIVADAASLASCLPPGIRPEDPVAAMGRCRAAGVRGVCLIPYRAVGVECGLLLALRATQVTVGGQPRGSCLLALSPTPVDDGGGYQALVGCAG